MISCRRKASSLSVHATKMTKKGSTVVNDITKSPLDKREYRGVILPNNMKVILISDSQTDKSAASLSVAVGKCDYVNQLSLRISDYFCCQYFSCQYCLIHR